jgi:ABC-type branched-subunit amino acid transport system ATPase component
VGGARSGARTHFNAGGSADEPPRPLSRPRSLDRFRRASNLTILLVEQRVVEALEPCDRGYVLETGRVALEGSQRALLADPRVQRAYLGA